MGEKQEGNITKRVRPRITKGPSHRVQTGCGKLYVRMGYDGEKLVELFATLGKAGGCAVAQLEALTRTITLGLRYNIPLEEFIKELEDIKCPSPVWEDGAQIKSCADAIAEVLRRECRNNQSSKVPEQL